MSTKRCVLLSFTAFLGVVSIAIIWRFLTVNYPTHSDVFFMGVEAGALAILLLVCVVLIGYFLFRVTLLSSRRKVTESG
jgi:hypothetical protein